MNRFVSTTATIALASALVACGGDDTSDNSVKQNYHDVKATLQGTVFDALTGARITDESLEVYLVQGTDYREAKVRHEDKLFAGDYAIGNLPTTTAGNITYRIAALAEGYQNFESAVSFTLNTAALQDEQANFLANMYLYPTGTYASNVTVNVSYNNEAVEGATVLLNPRTGSNQLTTDTSNTGLFVAQSGFQEALVATTDASGVATFEAANLVLGGQYNVDVMPITHEGIQLQVNRGTAGYFVVGATTTMRNVSMSQAAPGNDNGLYVTSISNADTDNVTTSGALTVKFSRAVTLVDETDIGADLSGDVVNAVLDTSNAPDSIVTASLSSDGMTLTLTPVFTTAPVVFDGTNSGTADDNLVVTFENVVIRLAEGDDTATAYTLFGNNGAAGALVDYTGVAPSADVQTTTDF